MNNFDEKTTFERWEFPEFKEENADTNHITDDDMPSAEKNSQEPILSLEDERQQEISALKSKLETNIAWVEEVIAELKTFKKKFVEEMMHDGVRLIYEITQKLVDKEIQANDEILKKQLDKALSQIDITTNDCQIKVSPNDLARAKDIFSDEKRIHIGSDESLAPGDFIIETAANEIKMDLKKRLTELFDV
tara:strand:+ start:707 stop:1279 length:573 start_codon:yes stop_codon:yes gene_type:complete